MVSDYNIDIDLKLRPSFPIPLKLNQYDRGVFVKVNLFDNGEPYTIADDETIQIDMALPDRNAYIISGESIYSISENTFKFQISRTVTLNSGMGSFNVAIVDKATGITKRKGSNKYTIEITCNSLSEDAIPSELMVTAKEELEQATADAVTAKTNLDNSLEDTKTVVDGLKLGGRNLVPNTGFYNGRSDWNVFNGATNLVLVSDNRGFTSQSIQCTLGSNANGAISTPYANCAGGNTYTVSMWIKLSQTGIVSNLMKFIDSEGTESNPINQPTGVNAPADTWVFIIQTFVAPSTAVKMRGTPRCILTLDGATMQVTEFQITEGNKYTTWQEAPEDISARISLNTANITANANNISSLTTKVNDNRIFSVASLTELNEALTSATRGTEIKIKPGTYTPDKSFEIPKGVDITGSGTASCLFNCNNTAINNVFRNKLDGTETAYNQFDITIKGINFNGVDTTNTITVVSFAHASNVTVKECVFRNFNAWHNIEVNGCSEAFIYKNKFLNYGNAGGSPSEVIQIDYCRDNTNYPWACNYDNTHCKEIYVEYNSFNNIFTTSSGAVGTHNYGDAGQHTDIYVRHNTLDKVQRFFYLLGAKRIHLDFNTGETVARFANLGYSGYWNQDAGTIIGNEIVGDFNTKYFTADTVTAQEGRFVYGLDTTATINNFTIANNVATEFTRHVIGLTCQKTTITGNTIHTGGYNGIYLYGGSQITCTGNSVSDVAKTDSNCSDIKYGGNGSTLLSSTVITGNNGNIVNAGSIGNNVTEINNVAN